MRGMPIAIPEIYAEMLDRAKAGALAYPAINVSSSPTLNAALHTANDPCEDSRSAGRTPFGTRA
jgi:fructose-bisphosphate aldolase class II